MRKQIYPEVVVGTFILNKKGMLLLVKSWKWPNLYAVPGGHVELGEGVAETAKREAKEEVGLNVRFRSIVNIQEAIYPKAFHMKVHFIFVEALCTVDKDKVRLDNDEIQDYLWIKPKDALRLNLNSYTRVTIEQLVKNKKQMNWVG